MIIQLNNSINKMALLTGKYKAFHDMIYYLKNFILSELEKIDFAGNYITSYIFEFSLDDGDMDPYYEDDLIGNFVNEKEEKEIRLNKIKKLEKNNIDLFSYDEVRLNIIQWNLIILNECKDIESLDLYYKNFKNFLIFKKKLFNNFKNHKICIDSCVEIDSQSVSNAIHTNIKNSYYYNKCLVAYTLQKHFRNRKLREAKQTIGSWLFELYFAPGGRFAKKAEERFIDGSKKMI